MFREPTTTTTPREATPKGEPGQYMESILWHTYEHVPHDVGDIYEVPNDQVQNLMNLHFAVPSEYRPPDPPEALAGRTPPRIPDPDSPTLGKRR